MKITEIISESFGNHYPTVYNDVETMPYKRKGQRRIGTLTTEEKTTLNKIYTHGLPDEDELIWQWIGYGDLETPVEVKRMIPQVLKQVLEMQYGVEDVEDIIDMLEPEQLEILDNYKSSDLSNQIIVTHNGKIVDGNHRALAAAMLNKSIKYIDLSDLDEEQIDEKWSQKYKRSIDCSHPKGFSQKAHCQGRKK